MIQDLVIKNNSAYIEKEGKFILIDCGLTKDEMKVPVIVIKKKI